MVSVKKDKEKEVEMYRKKYLNLRNTLHKKNKEYDYILQIRHVALNNLSNSRMPSQGRTKDTYSQALEKYQMVNKQSDDIKKEIESISNQLISLFKELKSKRLKKRVVDDYWGYSKTEFE